jgi:hypothetical protein
MNYAVLRLTAVGHAPDFSAQSFAESMLSMLLFELIFAFFAGDSSRG